MQKPVRRSELSISPRISKIMINLSLVKSNEKIVDAFCGIGSILQETLLKKIKVIGIENVLDAFENAKRNAQKNNITNVEFLCGRVEEKIQNLEKIDVAILNPPRSGCEITVLKKLIKLQPKKILYLSCSPISLARDLKYLSSSYTIQSVEPFDMFPQTSHVESLALLKKK